MSLIKKLAGETALYGLSSILGRLLTFVFLTPFLTHFFNNDRAQIGIQTDIYAWAAFLMILFTYRIETAFFKFGAKEKHVDDSGLLFALCVLIFLHLVKKNIHHCQS